MNITLMISSLGAGGAENVFSALANYLAIKHQVTIITLAAADSDPFYQLNYSIKLVYLNQTGDDRRSFLARILNIIKRIFSLRKAIKKTNANLVISFVEMMNISTILATLGLKFPTIISERIDPNFHKIPSFYNWLRLKFYPLCTQLVMQTNSAAKYFPESFQKFISIIANPVSDPDDQKIIYAKKITNIVSVGRLDPQKDHATLIKAFSIAAKQYPDLTLTIYGEGADRQKLEGLICDLKMDKKIHLPGTTKNIHSKLIDADLFIFPSIYEGFPNALCEAMAIGLPVIASNCSGNIDIIKDGKNGKLFPAGNEVSLARLINEYLDQPTKYSEICKNSKKITQIYHPDKIFSQWEKIIEQSLKI